MKAAALWQASQGGLRYGLYFPLAALFPLPIAYRLAQIWGRLEARRSPSELLNLIRTNAASVLRSEELPATDIGKQFFEVMSCDQIDAYASWLYSWHRLQRWVRMTGEERLFTAVAEKRGVLLLTFHFGGSSLIFPYLRSRGMSAHLVANSLQRTREVGGGVQYTFSHLRFQHIERLMDREVIFVGGVSPRKIHRALAKGGMVVALLDVAPEFVGLKEWKEGREVSFLGRPARFPTGLLSIAARADAVIVPFFGWVGADRHRHLSFEEPCRAIAPSETLPVLVGLLERYIRHCPGEWHHWPAAQAFYRQAS